MVAIVRPVRLLVFPLAAARKWGKQQRLRIAAAVLASLVLHALVAVPLARWLLPASDVNHLDSVVEVDLSNASFPEPVETLDLAPLPALVVAGTPLVPALVDMPLALPQARPVAAPSLPATPLPAIRTSEIDFVPLLLELPGTSAPSGAMVISEFAGLPAARDAIDHGLAWLARHQHTDGGWRFDLHGGPCHGQCRNSGAERSTTAATGLALLPLLNAEGSHAAAVDAGLAYLGSRLIATPHGGDLQEGTMYGQGLATLALARGLEHTGDQSLREKAQQAALFIVHAQHPRGGWRYFPGQAGDITVVGWQIASLDAARRAGVVAPDETLNRAGEFLDSVQVDDGSAYGYQRAEMGRTPSAIGLACRMRLGWHPLDSRIERGAEQIAVAGPSYDDMYFNHYAAFVLRESGNAQWPAFRERLVKQLLAVQATSGHEAGSWHFADPHTQPGGRLCDTALAILILQICSSQ